MLVCISALGVGFIISGVEFVGGEGILVGRGYWWGGDTGGEGILVGRKYWWGGDARVWKGFLFAVPLFGK